MLVCVCVCVSLCVRVLWSVRRVCCPVQPNIELHLTRCFERQATTDCPVVVTPAHHRGLAGHHSSCTL